MSTHEQSTDSLESLLRGEISAIETYSHAIHKFPGAAFFPDLHSIRNDHQESVGLLRKLLQRNGEDPPTSSGAWGSFAKAVEGTAAAFGEKAALCTLKEGEEHGIKVYAEALEDEAVSRDIKSAIEAELLPPLREHVAVLEKLIEGSGQ